MAGRQKILIVDDRLENLFALEKILSVTGAEILKATSGNDALIASLNHEFALAILDVQMPGMNGYELADYLRGEKKTRYLPVIFLTAVHSDEYHVFKGYEAGAVDFITKPFNPEILVGKVSVFLELDRQRAEQAEHRARMEILVRVSTGVLAQDSIEGLLRHAADAARELTGAQKAMSGYGLCDGIFRVGAASVASPCSQGDLLSMPECGLYLDLLGDKKSIR
jgi:DNA-binding response OmpR family regulator